MSHHKTLNGLWTQVVIELRVFVVIFGFKGHDESKTERAVVKACLLKSSYCQKLEKFLEAKSQTHMAILKFILKFTSFPRVEHKTPMCNLIHLPVA